MQIFQASLEQRVSLNIVEEIARMRFTEKVKARGFFFLIEKFVVMPPMVPGTDLQGRLPPEYRERRFGKTGDSGAVMFCELSDSCYAGFLEFLYLTRADVRHKAQVVVSLEHCRAVIFEVANPTVTAGRRINRPAVGISVDKFKKELFRFDIIREIVDDWIRSPLAGAEYNMDVFRHSALKKPEEFRVKAELNDKVRLHRCRKLRVDCLIAERPERRGRFHSLHEIAVSEKPVLREAGLIGNCFPGFELCSGKCSPLLDPAIISFAVYNLTSLGFQFLEIHTFVRLTFLPYQLGLLVSRSSLHRHIDVPAFEICEIRTGEEICKIGGGNMNALRSPFHAFFSGMSARLTEGFYRAHTSKSPPARHSLHPIAVLPRAHFEVIIFSRFIRINPDVSATFGRIGRHAYYVNAGFRSTSLLLLKMLRIMEKNEFLKRLAAMKKTFYRLSKENDDDGERRPSAFALRKGVSVR